MLRPKALVCLLATVASTLALADGVTLVDYNAIEIPVTPFSNMASGYQATNPGFRAVIRSEGGDFIAGGPLTMDAVMRGYTDDASQGTAYGRLILRVDMLDAYPGVSSGIMNGTYRGTLSICMAKDTESPIRATECRPLGGNIHPERPFQWIDKPIEFTVTEGNIRITQYFGNVGEGGSKKQLSLALYHPAFGFAAPGKSFKDYQSPLVLDLDRNDRLDLINVWDDKRVIRFDLNGVGDKVRTGWVSPQDGLLFWDDGSGCVKDGTQLFGEYTGSKDGRRTFENGFKALAAKLGVRSGAKVVTARHKRLKVWRNWGADGICRPGEVYPASQFVKEIHLGYETHKNPPLNEDNEVRLTGKYTAPDGTKRLIGDVWFKQRRYEGGPAPLAESKIPATRTLDEQDPGTSDIQQVKIEVSKRVPVNVADVMALRTYANDNKYYHSVNLKEGMRVLFSASYGIGGEAGQAAGVLVQKNGRFFFKQKKNPTGQLMLPPGMPFNSQVDHSLWDIGAYMDLVNRVAFSDPNAASKTSFDVYSRPEAHLVDFKGGTAGGLVTYQDALEVTFAKQVASHSSSDLRIYYAKGIGPVALEFRENLSPAGTFKLYLGE